MPCETIKNGIVGTGFPIQDAPLKATGQTRYVADMKLPGMLFAKVLFSPVAHARIKRIDISKAESLAGVRAVLCYKNTSYVAYNGTGESIDKYKTERIFTDTVRYVGDRIAAVAAVDIAVAEKALKLIEVEYEELPVYTDPEEALREDAYPIHSNSGLERGNLIETVRQSCGDVDEAMAAADRIFEDTYTCPSVHHGAMETHACIASVDANKKLTVYTTSQDTFAMRVNLCRIFSMPMSKVRVIVPAMGGSFGGRVDMIIEPVAAALALESGSCVKLVYSRREEIVSTRTRHAIKINVKTGVSQDGEIVAEDMMVFCNAGAYAGGTTNIVWSMCAKIFKVHRCKNIRFQGLAVITNTPVGGPMRGFGSPQVFFAQQRHLNQIANALGIDMMELQMRNLTFSDGKDYRFNQPHGNAQPRACLKKAAELIGYELAAAEQRSTKQERYRIGVGIGVGAHGNGMYGLMTDTTALMLKMNGDGTCVLYTAANDMGNSSITMQMQMISEVLGISMGNIASITADTDATPYQMGDYTSRGAYVSAHAAVRVAQRMREKVLRYAVELLNHPQESLETKQDAVWAPDGRHVTLEQVVQHARHRHFEELMSQVTYASEAAVTSYGAHIAKVQVDTETGKVRVLEYAAVHDVGKAINPLSVQGQLEGAVQMGIGYALMEHLGVDEAGKVRNSTFRTYHMPYAHEMPQRLWVDVADSIEQTGPFGAKSIGECAVVPSAAALANAVSNAIGAGCNDLPIMPERVLAAMKEGRMA